MNMQQAVASVLRNYVTFSGRAPRSEFWWWSLATILFGFAVAIIDMMFFADQVTVTTGPGEIIAEYENGPLSALYSLAIFLPGLAVSVRRLHDVNKSGWWLFILLVPLFGFFYLLYLYVQPGEQGDNHFGADPLYSPIAAAMAGKPCALMATPFHHQMTCLPPLAPPASKAPRTASKSEAEQKPKPRIMRGFWPHNPYQDKCINSTFGLRFHVLPVRSL